MRRNEIVQALVENDAARRAQNAVYLQRSAALQAELAALPPELAAPAAAQAPVDVVPAAHSPCSALEPAAELAPVVPSELEQLAALELEHVTELPPPPALPNEATLLEAMPPSEPDSRELELELKPETD